MLTNSLKRSISFIGVMIKCGPVPLFRFIGCEPHVVIKASSQLQPLLKSTQSAKYMCFSCKRYGSKGALYTNEHTNYKFKLKSAVLCDLSISGDQLEI